MMTCNLKNILENADMSVRYLSIRTGVSVRSLYRYINRERIPDLLTAIKIAESLDVTVDDIWKFG